MKQEPGYPSLSQETIEDLDRYVPVVEHALTGYAHDGGSWQHARGRFEEVLIETESVDAALRVALETAADRAETSPEAATAKFWERAEGEGGPHALYGEAINRALTNYAPDGGSWLYARDTFFYGMRKGYPVEASLSHALSMVTQGAQSSTASAMNRFWGDAKEPRKDTGERLLHRTDLVGRGEQAVFAAEVDGQPAIIKRGSARRLETEYATLRSVSRYEGFPKPISFRNDGDTGELVMGRLPGKGLNEIVGLTGDWKSKRLPTDTAVEIVQQLGDRLAALSKEGYLYRDLNFAHILVEQRSKGLEVGLVDLEACERKSGHGAKVHRYLGTWEVMAPEEFQMGSTITEASNVYSLGVLLMQLTTGENPFHIDPSVLQDDNTRRSMVEFLHEGGLEAYPHANTPLGHVLKRALRPDPARRYSTIRDFQEALTGAMHGQR